MADLSLTSTFQLNNGNAMPILAFGTASKNDSKQEVLTALRHSYTHIDTAHIYGTEKDVGEAIRASGIPRSKLFIASKLWDPDFTRDGALQGVKQSLDAMQLDYLDLFLLHNPRGGAGRRRDAWLGLQDAVQAGLVRSIGVSNWSIKHLEQLAQGEGVKIVPACNQIEFHPWNQQAEIVKYCKGKGIQITAFSALAQGKRMDDKLINSLAAKYGKSPSQVILRWMVQRQIVPITKSSKEERVKQTTEIFGWELDPKDCEDIDKLDEGMKARIGDWDPDEHE
ncbi:Prostaglandin F synthase [Cladophialophora carrionii]|uniref:Prostaglandin F synthase n=1 Tax=Cladophialophora carrionii TaxID=86049 RepID=A0A1C1CWJ2_9EURO|nr:Prostaglandin F synthase [Cladophialophora carrionii]